MKRIIGLYGKANCDKTTTLKQFKWKTCNSDREKCSYPTK